MLPLKHGPEASRSRRKFELAFAVGPLFALFVACSPEPQVAGATERVVILPREVDELDPRYVGDAYGLKVSRLLYASLVTIDPRTLSPVLDLAERLTVEGPLRYRVSIRRGLHFADGSELDAHDVVATFRALVDPRVKSRYRSSYERMRSVSADDDHTVTFELSEPNATFATDLEMPVLRQEDALRVRQHDHLPVASGPYQLRSRGKSALLLVPNFHYRADVRTRPNLRFVVVRDDNVRALRMLAAGGDLAQSVLPHLLLPLFEARRDLRVLSTAGAGTSYVGINLTHPRLCDLRIRTALAHAIDRQRLVTYKLGGRATLASSWIPVGHWAHAADTPSHAFDPHKARALLREAGLERGQSLRLVMRTSSDRAVVSLARAMASMLADVGFELEVRPSETATLLSDLARGRYELSLLQVPEVFEPNVLSWFFASDRIPELGVREGGNRSRLRDARLDRLLLEGRQELERERRVAIYREVQHLLAHQLPVIPLWHEDVVAVVSRRMFSYQVPRDARFGTLAAWGAR